MRNLINIIDGASGHRLDELSRPPLRADATVVLKNAGYKRLGRGAFASVFHKPGKDYVLKVFSAKDEAYLAFIALAKTHLNPHFPRFLGKIVKVTDDYCAIRMELLKPYRYDPSQIDLYIRTRDWVPEDPNSYYAQQVEDAREFMGYRPELKLACDLIVDKLLTRPGIERDIRQDNIMMRGDTIVLTDPVKAPAAFDGSAADEPYSQPEPPPPSPMNDRKRKQMDDLLDQILNDPDFQELIK